MTLADGAKYRVYWETAPDEMQNVTDETSKLFKATGYTLNKNNGNSKCVSTLLNTSNWTKYLDKEDGTGKANSAIGSPTIEMWMESWNNLYENVDGKLYCNNVNENGYYIGDTLYSKTTEINLNSKKGKGNKLYFPYDEGVTDAGQSSNSYWLSSTTSGISGLLRIRCDGNMGDDGYYGVWACIRPVVCINENQKLDVKE